MSLVGDIILELRARIPDAPPVSNPPNVLSITPIFDPSNQPGLTGIQVIAVTSTNTWGETVMSPQSPEYVTISPPNNALQINVGAAPPPLYININVYQAGWNVPPSLIPSALLDQWIFPMPASGQITITLPGTAGVPNHTGGPPTRSTAFNPDNDGNFLGAYHAYRMLNRALSAMVKIAGGIVDVTGVQSNINQSMYRMNTPFYQFVNAWYDGYPMDIVPRNFMYLRNSAAGFSGILSYEQDGPQSTIQVWPQSNRTGGQANVIGEIGATDDSFFATPGNPTFLSIGLAQIDNEVVAYSRAQNQYSVGLGNYQLFSGVLRGMGGTDAVAHNAGAPITELNIRMSGYRMCKTYNVGNALQTIMVPQAWEEPLVLHMLSQVRSMEQDEAAAKELLAQFVADAEKIAKGSRLGRIKPRQIPIWGQNTSDARNVNGIGFGWLIN